MLKMRHVLSNWVETRRKDLTLPGKSLWLYERVDMRAEKKDGHEFTYWAKVARRTKHRKKRTCAVVVQREQGILVKFSGMAKMKDCDQRRI